MLEKGHLLTKTPSKGNTYSKGGAYWEEGAKSNHCGLWVIYDLPQIPGNSCWDVNGKRFFGSSHWKIPRDKWKFWKANPVFPIGKFIYHLQVS